MELYSYDASLAGSSYPKNWIILQKLTGHCTDILSGKELETIQQLLKNTPHRKQDIILLCLAESGGAFRKQMQYLGLFSNGVQYKQYMSLVKRSYAALGNVIEQNSYDDKNFYYLSKESAALADSILQSANSLKSSIPALPFSHSENMEHAAGFNDYLLYILGNNHYPVIFRLCTEKAVRSDDDSVRYCVPDATNTTLYAGKTLIDDFIEVHTGTQRAGVVASKLEAYLNHLECLNSNIEQTHTYETADIIFLIHPSGVCANYRRIPGRRTPDGMSRYTVADADTLLNTASLLLQELQTRRLADGFLTMQQVLKNCHGIYEHFLSAAGLEFRLQEIDAIYCLLTMIPELTDMTSRVELLESFQDILAVHEIPQDYCSEGITDESKDFYLVYRKQKKLIENAIRRELPASYPIAAGSLKAAVLNGFSVYTVYGADMYDTFLGVHPHFSGAYIAILQYLFAYGIISGNICNVLPGHKAKLDEEHAVVFRNYYCIKDEDGCMTDVYIEDLSSDYGARIRVREYIARTGIDAQRGMRLICIVDSAAAAYNYLAEYCYNVLRKKGRCITAKCLYPDISVTQAKEMILNGRLALPLFITKADIKAAMRSLPESNGLFAFFDTTVYQDAARGYGRPDSKFPVFLNGIITKNGMGGDILYLN